MTYCVHFLSALYQPGNDTLSCNILHAIGPLSVALQGLNQKLSDLTIFM